MSLAAWELLTPEQRAGLLDRWQHENLVEKIFEYPWPVRTRNRVTEALPAGDGSSAVFRPK